MLGQRRRRSPNITSALAQCIALSGSGCPTKGEVVVTRMAMSRSGHYTGIRQTQQWESEPMLGYFGASVFST